MRSRISLLFCLLGAIGSANAFAEPSVGASLGVGNGVATDSTPRGIVGIDVLSSDARFRYGAELSASYGGYTGGWACDQRMPEGSVVPAIAQWCDRPIVSSHALASVEDSWGRFHGRLQAGLGAAHLWSPRAGGDSASSLHPSALVRADVLTSMPSWSGHPWRLGLRLQHQVLPIGQMTSLGLAVEFR